MVKWMYYLAVAMLLAAAADAAAVSVDVPAAVVDAGAVDVPAVAVDSSLVITLKQFLWTATPIEKTTAETTYDSLVITFEGDPAITINSGTCNIVYRKGEEPEVNEVGEVVGSVCTIALTAFTLPIGEIKYELGVDDNGKPDVHYIGSATFEVKPDDFNQGESGAISCSGVSYTRTVVAKKKNCADLNGVGVELDGTNYACYVPTTTGRSSESQTTDGNGCIGLPDSSGIQVCLSDKKFLGVAVKADTSFTIDSLTYGDGDTDATLAITYTDAHIPPVGEDYLEVILQDTTSASTPFYVGVIPLIEGPLPVPILTYVPTSAPYEVCGVLSLTATPDGALQTVANTDGVPSITDLNVFMVEDGTAELVEFGFNNARVEEADRQYYATLEDSATRGTNVVEVGIDCGGVLAGHTCYGFLSTTDMIGAKTLTVGYGNEAAGAFADPANKIIGTVPDPPTK